MNIVIEERINVLENIKKLLSGGHILAVYREADSILAGNILADIVREYKVTKKVLPTRTEISEEVLKDVENVDDDVRLILTFGGENVIELGKIASTMMGIPLIIYLTTANIVKGDRTYIFENGCLIERNVSDGNLLLCPIANVIRRSDFSSILGDISSCLLGKVDRIFADLLDEKFPMLDISKITKVLDDFDINDRENILRQCYSIDEEKSYFIEMLSKNIAHVATTYIDSSNIKFALTYTILLMYRGYLKYVGDDLILPPDIVSSAKIANRIYDIDMNESIIGYKMMSSSEYDRMIHVIDEYRFEMLDVVNKAIDSMQRLSRIFRRLSKDTGSTTYDELSLDTMLESVSLLSIFIKDNSILRIMKSSGLLERYIRA